MYTFTSSVNTIAYTFHYDLSCLPQYHILHYITLTAALVLSLRFLLDFVPLFLCSDFSLYIFFLYIHVRAQSDEAEEFHR